MRTILEIFVCALAVVGGWVVMCHLVEWIKWLWRNR